MKTHELTETRSRRSFSQVGDFTNTTVSGLRHSPNSARISGLESNVFIPEILLASFRGSDLKERQ